MSQNLATYWNNEDTDILNLLNQTVTGTCIQSATKGRMYTRVLLPEGKHVKILGDPVNELLTWENKKDKIDRSFLRKSTRKKKSRRKNPVAQQLTPKQLEKEFPLNGLTVNVVIEKINGNKYYGRILSIVE